MRSYLYQPPSRERALKYTTALDAMTQSSSAACPSVL